MRLNKIILGMAMITLLASTSAFAFASSDTDMKLAKTLGASSITKTIPQRGITQAFPLKNLGKSGDMTLRIAAPLNTITATPASMDECILVKQVEGGIEIIRAQAGTLKPSDFGAVMKTAMPAKLQSVGKAGNK